MVTRLFTEWALIPAHIVVMDRIHQDFLDSAQRIHGINREAMKGIDWPGDRSLTLSRALLSGHRMSQGAFAAGMKEWPICGDGVHFTLPQCT